jgi:hypothetical protein
LLKNSGLREKSAETMAAQQLWPEEIPALHSQNPAPREEISARSHAISGAELERGAQPATGNSCVRKASGSVCEHGEPVADEQEGPAGKTGPAVHTRQDKPASADAVSERILRS